jgi:hypothetical protein
MNYHRMILAVAPALLPAVLLAAELRTIPLVLDKGGTKEQPAVFDGRGMTVDLAIDVTEHAWTKADNLWTSTGPLLGRTPLEAGQLAGLFVDEVPIAIPRDVAAEKLRPDRKQYNRCVTSYRDCTIHDNLGAAFYFSGKSHTVTDTLIYNQTVDFRVLGETRLQRDRIQWLPMAPNG